MVFKLNNISTFSGLVVLDLLHMVECHACVFAFFSDVIDLTGDEDDDDEY